MTAAKDFFVHISAVERAGMQSLNEGQKVSYDIVADRGPASRRLKICEPSDRSRRNADGRWGDPAAVLF
jgi:hypothetical protein